LKKPTRGQHSAWADGGAADNWFERNREKIASDSATPRSTALFASYIRPGQSVLEIGASNGHQLNRLQQLTSCEAFGIDPSKSAIADGKSKYPSLRLSAGTADKLEFQDESFDAVILGLCLYLVDRSLLMRAVAESDRVLRRNGMLMIVDFDPAVTHRRPFTHQQGLWSYKMRYPDLWLANPDYVLAEKCTYSHQGDHFHADPGERVSAWILVKQQHDAAYPRLE
jgi:ubiquinone/menaquinone biosynthesis C-methylase UbiE